MSRTFGNPADYSGRLFDLLAFRGAVPVGQTLLDQTLFGTDASGEVCTGVQMLAQRWLLKFLTISGSMTYLPDEGTDFIGQVRRGELVTESDIEGAFNIAAVEVRTALLNEETDAMNDEERMDSAELLQITLADDSFSLTVEITSLAGTSRKVILPIPYLPIKVGP